MGKKKELTVEQWGTIGERLLAGEKAADLAREYGIPAKELLARFPIEDKLRNKVASDAQKGTKNTAKHPEIVKPPEKRGRVSTFSEEVAEEICGRIAEGEPLRQICREEGMPAWRTVYDWINAHEEFAARIARARTLGFDAIAEECLEIADTPRAGIKTKTGADGIEITEEDMLGHRKLQIETRLKLLAKWSPRYSDRAPAADPNPKGQQDGIPHEPEYALKTDEPLPDAPIL